MEPVFPVPNGASDGCDVVRWFEHVSENAGPIQTDVLCRILKENCGVEYLRKWFGNRDVCEMDACALESLFSSMVPIASHSDFEPFIQKIADGDTAPILTQQPLTTLSLSSGTTEGRQKFVPFTRHSAQTTLQTFTLASAYRSRVYPIKEGGRTLEFIYSSNQFKTKGGLTVGTATTHYYASQEFKLKQHQTKSFTCSPYEVISGGDYKQSTYCHLLLGLHFSRNVELITSAFVYGIVQALRTFQDIWQEICDDIKNGTLSPKITVPKMREAVLGIISPNPRLGSEIEDKCKDLEGSGWLGLVPRLWPNAKYVYSIMTGSMQPYLKKLRHYVDGLPLVSGDYGSTESWVGVNVDPGLPPERVTFAVVPTFSYFEFIPVYRRKQSDCGSVGDDFVEGEAIPLSKVEVGQEYELVLTTFTGLYRCRLGDVVEVAGFHNKTPKLNFICRRKLILTINIDKNTEKDLQIAVDKASHLLQDNNNAAAELVDFTSHADVSTQPGRYVIFWEIEGEAEDEAMEACCNEMDLAFADYGYVVSRKSSSIGPLELCIVERGSFKKILDYFVANGAALGQYKTPRCTNNPVLLEILRACTVKRFHSTAYS